MATEMQDRPPLINFEVRPVENRNKSIAQGFMVFDDKDFALDEGLLPKNLAHGKIALQFATLAAKANINEKTFQFGLNAILDKIELLAQQ
jgi:hypothetical protein